MLGYSFYLSMRFWQRVLLVSEVKRKDHENLIKERADLKQKINNFVESKIIHVRAKSNSKKNKQTQMVKG